MNSKLTLTTDCISCQENVIYIKSNVLKYLLHRQCPPIAPDGESFVEIARLDNVWDKSFPVFFIFDNNPGFETDSMSFITVHLPRFPEDSDVEYQLDDSFACLGMYQNSLKELAAAIKIFVENYEDYNAHSENKAQTQPLQIKV